MRRGDSPELSTTPASPCSRFSTKTDVSSAFRLLRAGPLAGCAFRRSMVVVRDPLAVDGMFSSLSFNQLACRFWDDRKHGRKPAVVPEVSSPSRRTNAAERPVGILLFPVSVGVIAAAIVGVFFGIGFWLLASPASQTISDSGRDPSRPNGSALKAGETVLRLAGATETPRSTAVNLIPGSPPGQGPAAADAAPPQQHNVVREPSAASPNGEPSVQTASVPQPVSSLARADEVIE
jgi:hypothetical protein